MIFPGEICQKLYTYILHIYLCEINQNSEPNPNHRAFESLFAGIPPVSHDEVPVTIVTFQLLFSFSPSNGTFG